jgi:hypothetical protein
MEPILDKNQLCAKIREIYPDIGRCGIDIDVTFDQKEERWVVDLKRDNHALKTYLEPGDAELCLSGRQCIGLSVEVAQLVGNIERMP